MNNELIKVEEIKEPIKEEQKSKKIIDKKIIDKKILLIPILIIIGIVIIVFLTPGKKKANIIVENEYLSLIEGTIYNYKSISYPNLENITIESLNEDIVSIEKETDIKALKEGTATLLLKNTKEEKKVIVEVTKEEISLQKIDIKEETINLKYEEQYLIEIKTEPINATNKDIIWTSSDEDIVTINNGYIKAVGIGKAKIEASINGCKDIVTVIVGKENENVKVEEIEFASEIITVGLNNTYQLNPIIYPGNASNKKIEYIVEEEGIIEISNLGLIKGIRKGTTKVTALSSSGISKELEIKVEETDASIVLNVEEIQIARNETYQLKSDYVSGIEWYSSNEKVVTVDNGLIKGINDGKAVVTVINSYGRMNSVNVTVKGKGTSATKIEASVGEISLQVGKSYQLEGTVYPSNATNKDIYWETSDSRIATVTNEGLVFGKYEGEATITGYTLNNKQTTVNVNVSNLNVSIDSLNISPSSISIKKGDEYQLLATTIPSNTLNKEIKWESSNEKVVSVENGLIKGNKTGSATIYATVEGIKAKSQIEVIENVIEISKLDIKEENIEMNIGESKVLNLTYLPTNATNKTFKWESSDNNIVTVINGKVTALASGEAVVTVESNNKKDTLKVKVLQPEGGNADGILAVEFNYSPLILSVGQTKQVRATIIPLNKNQSVKWVNGDTNIARINENGEITALNCGKTTIAAIAKNGMMSKMDVYVTYPQIDASSRETVNKRMDSDTLRVIVSKDGTHKITRIWAADPYNQFHKIDSLTWGDRLTESVGEMLNRAIKERELYNSIMVGSNASYVIYESSEPPGPITITEGVTKKFLPGTRQGRDLSVPTAYYGMDSNGMLVELGPAKPFNKQEETDLYNKILNAGIKNTIGMPIGNVLVRDGHVTNAYVSEYSVWETLCQVDTNNFILMTTGGGTTLLQAATLQMTYGCVTGFNLDGGGSSNSFYKNRGDSTMTPIYSTNRNLAEAIYFSEI